MTLKRLLAGSTSSQLGLMLLAIGAGSVSAAIFHLVAQAAMKSTLFLAAGVFQHDRNSTAFDDLRSVSRQRRAMLAAFTVAGLALAGVPPLAGFWSKDAILAATLHADAAVLAPLGVAASVVTGLYIGRSLRLLWQDSATADDDADTAGAVWMGVRVGALALLATLLGLAAEPFASLLNTHLPEDVIAVAVGLLAAVTGLLLGWSFQASGLIGPAHEWASTGFRIHDGWATEAGMRYFVFGSVTGAVMIFGLTFWFGGSGSTLLTDLGQLEGRTLAAAMGLVAATVGLGYKAAVAPFHFWAPDAYEGGPLVVAAYLSIVPKIGAIFALAVIAQSLPTEIVDWRLLFAVLAIVSMTYGNLAALVQTNVVRLLAYSSIAQAGYFLIGVVAIGRDALAVQSLVVFAAAYAAMNLGAFAITRETGCDLGALTGLGRTRLATGIAMSLFLFSLVGIPPMAGFFGKLLLFGSAIDAGYTWLAIVGIMNSVMSLAVYLRILVPMYRPTEGSAKGEMLSGAVWGVALVLTVVLGIALDPITSALGS